MKKLNDINNICNKCGGPTESLFGTGRSSWCPQCEGVKPEKTKDTQQDSKMIASDDDDPFGFQIIEVEIEDN